jgi:hypothetical protein
MRESPMLRRSNIGVPLCGTDKNGDVAYKRQKRNQK